MSKLLDKSTAMKMLKRIEKLSPYATPRWGNLTVKGMMFHYTFVTNEIFSAKTSSEKPTTKQLITKFVGLYAMKNFPKGIKSSAKYVNQEANTLHFEKEKTNLVAMINKIATYKEPIYGKHPFFGPMQTKEWRRFLYKHLDHHLSQFGV